MFTTILTSITANGTTIKRVYEGRTEQLSVYFATNLWATYDRDHGEHLVSLETTEKDVNYRSLDMIDNRNLCSMHPNDEAAHA